MATTDVYQKLAQHLDRLPGGFPPGQTGAELRMLRILFTTEEAEIASQLTLEPEEAATIGRKVGRPQSEMEKQLEEMARKGLIFSVRPSSGPVLYRAAPWVVGIWEFQVNNLQPALLKEMGEWQKTRQPRPVPTITGQMRTIPVRKSIPVQLQVLPWEQVDELTKEEDRFAVAPCICRRVAKIAGTKCQAPEESCLLFGDFADFYVGTGRARRIDRPELERILEKADEHNLVLQPSTSQRAEFICCCCGDCCAVLRSARSYSRPFEVVSSGFVASLDTAKCEGCQTCLTRCQMQALAADGDTVSLKTERCIGCGLCTSTCPGGALTLERRSGSAPNQIPERWIDTLRSLSKVGR